MSHGPKARVGVLLSGRGSNFLALDDAMRRGEVPAEVAVVVSNRADAAGIERARQRGIPAVVVPHRDAASREAHDAAILGVLADAGVEWVCLAGYLRLLTPSFVAAFPRRILNVHPSLLPSFPGLDAQAQALRHGVRVTGCTVHLVDEQLDHGPIVVQRPVVVRDDDDVASLARRILVEEHRAYPQALRRLLTEPWEVEGRRVSFAAAEKSSAGN